MNEKILRVLKQSNVEKSMPDSLIILLLSFFNEEDQPEIQKYIENKLDNSYDIIQGIVYYRMVLLCDKLLEDIENIHPDDVIE